MPIGDIVRISWILVLELSHGISVTIRISVKLFEETPIQAPGLQSPKYCGGERHGGGGVGWWVYGSYVPVPSCSTVVVVTVVACTGTTSIRNWSGIEDKTSLFVSKSSMISATPSYPSVVAW